ncbi:hypothetical protein QJS10_CPA16g00212 [Acorus calamus]|uniref:Reverse transcriptase zinc-binding domain-containing protein n=1 Tax=Acorus calamus TaxID=4465 RepID=A0AAV9D2F5_ACOCL|nr:hypothetical protein QJS10_CPA16g00212 [Acorus calamus]
MNGTNREIRKPHLVRWEMVCLPRDKGWLGIRRLEKMNTSLLAKWNWKWLLEPEALWVRIVQERYGVPQGSHIPRLLEHGGSGSAEASSQGEVSAEVLMGILRTVTLFGNSSDQVRWQVDPSRGYSARTGYYWLVHSAPSNALMIMKQTEIWRPRIPLKIKAFLWLAYQGQVLVYRVMGSLDQLVQSIHGGAMTISLAAD